MCEIKLSVNFPKIQIVSNSETILKGINFKLTGGNLYGIIGDNGTGKTTLLKCITGLQDEKIISAEGEVLLNGQNILKLNNGEMRILRQKQIRYIFQNPSDSFDPFRKIRFYFPPDIPQERISEYSEILGLPSTNEFLSAFPHELSVGQLQRIALLFALVSRPQILFLDEPTSALDLISAESVSNLLCKMADEGGIIFLVSHDLGFLKDICTQIAYVNEKTLSPFITKTEFFDYANINSDYLRSLIDSYRFFYGK